MFWGQASSKFNNNNKPAKQTDFTFSIMLWGCSKEQRAELQWNEKLGSHYDTVTVLMSMTKWQRSCGQVTGTPARCSVCATFIKRSHWQPPVVLWLCLPQRAHLISPLIRCTLARSHEPASLFQSLDGEPPRMKGSVSKRSINLHVILMQNEWH